MVHSRSCCGGCSIPPGGGLKDYRSAAVRCEQFSVLISPAGLVTRSS
jgi:hypothetical protein